jgi:hypothetical protein
MDPAANVQEKGFVMLPTTNRLRFLPVLAGMLALAATAPPESRAASGYVSARGEEVLQPGQKVFITWDPVKREESFTVQPSFEGNARDFGMIVATPSRPKLDEMPRDLFKQLAVFTALKQREHPESKLLPAESDSQRFGGKVKVTAVKQSARVVVLESGVAGWLDYKILSAERADELYRWLKANKYSYAGDEATLNFYLQKKWVFTVLKIDVRQLTPNRDGSYTGEITPTRFKFATDKLVYPLKITQLSVKDRTEAVFYVQAPYKVDLQGDLSYQYQWVPMLRAASGGLPGKGADWLKALDRQLPALLKHGQELGFALGDGQQARPNKQGRVPTTLEWARRLTAEDVKVLTGKAPYSEAVPDVDEGFSRADLKEKQRAAAIFKVIKARLARERQERPLGYLVREAPAEDVRALQHLARHLQPGTCLTRFRKVFTRDEMNDDLVLVRAGYGGQEDDSEYEAVLPTPLP